MLWRVFREYSSVGSYPFPSLHKEGATGYISLKDCGVSEFRACGPTSPNDLSVAVPVDKLQWH